MTRDDEHTSPGDAAESGDAMTPTPEERRALEALRSLPAARPAAAARERARRAFVHGSAASESAASQASEANAAQRVEIRSSGRAAEAQVVPMGRRRATVWLPVAMAAALLVAFLGFWGSQSRMEWQLVGLRDPDGQFAGNPARQVGNTLEPGFVESPEHGELDIALGSELRLRLAPCSGLYLPKPPRKWLAGELVVEMQRGEVFGSTGGDPMSVPLLLATKEATACIQGTTFAVFMLDEGSCVCLLDGDISITMHDSGETLELPNDSRILMYNDGREPEIVPITETEEMKLLMIRDTAAEARLRAP